MKTNLARAIAKAKHRGLQTLCNEDMYKSFDEAELQAIVYTVNKIISAKCERKRKHL